MSDNSFSSSQSSNVLGHLLNAQVDKQFGLRAFEDYCRKKSEAYQNLIACITECVEMVPDDDSLEFVPISADDPIIVNLINKYSKVGDQNILLNYGYVKLSDMLVSIYNNVGVASDIDSNVLSCDSIIQSVNAKGEVTASLSFDEIVDDMKSNLHSVIALVAGCSAMSVEAIGDRVTIFRDEMGQIFGSAMADVSGSANALLNVVKNSVDSVSFLSSVRNMLNVDALAEDDSEETPMNSDIYKFSGASPVGPLCFDTIGNAVSSVANVAVKAVGAVFSGLFWGVKKLFSWGASAINRLVGDPYDLKVRDEKAETNTIDGFCWTWSGLDMLPLKQASPDDPLSTADEILVSALKDHLVSSRDNEFYSVKTMFAEYLFKINDIYISRREDLEPDAYIRRLAVQYTIQIKFKPINPNIATNFIKATFSPFVSTASTFGDGNKVVEFIPVTKDSNGDYTIKSTYELFSARLAALCDEEDLYYNEKKSEKELYQAFCTGFLLSALCNFVARIQLAKGQSTGDFDGSLTDYISSNFIFRLPCATTVSDGYDTWKIQDSINTPSKVTNNNFLRIASGWDPATDQFGYNSTFVYSHGSTQLSTLEGSIKSYLILPVFAVVLNQIDQFNFPLDFAFVPYRNATEVFSTSRYSIKTDDENRNAFNTFAVIAVVAVIAIAVSVTLGPVVKRIIRKIRIKKIGKLKQIEQKLYNGDKLTRREEKAYLRSIDKGKRVKKIQSGLLDSAPPDPDDTELALDMSFANLQNLISGGMVINPS